MQKPGGSGGLGNANELAGTVNQPNRGMFRGRKKSIRGGKVCGTQIAAVTRMPDAVGSQDD
jgi:hypothetical protein